MESSSNTFPDMIMTLQSWWLAKWAARKQMQFNATLNYLPQATYTRASADPGAAATGAVTAEPSAKSNAKA